jgi:iron complex transport system substrate-binding protein
VSRRFSVLPLLAVAIILLGCSDDAEPAGPLSFTGSDGVTVTLDGPPRRIVSLASHATEIFCAIGAGDQLVAVDRFANCPLGSNAKPQIDSLQPSIEAIVAFQPDLVYAWYDPGELAEGLRRAGIKVLFLAVPDTLEGVFENIELIGRLTGREREASVLVTQMKARQDDITEEIKDVTTGPRVFHELDRELFTLRSDTFTGELYRLLKAQNIADDSDTPYPQLSSEAVVARDPQVIVLTDGEKPEDVRRRPGWSGISAVRDGRICEVDPDLTDRPGPRIMEGLAALHECLYRD